MVNTFLIFDKKKNEDLTDYFSRCLSHLDTSRLGKQRLEAKQVYDLIQDYYFISEFLNINIPKKLTKEWAQMVYQKYKEWFTNTNKIYFNKKTQRYTFNKSENCRNILYTFRMHPVVIMWLGYDHILAHYYNICLEEWTKRPTKSGRMCINNMPFLEVSEPLDNYPEWLDNPDFSSTHRMAMIRKEIARDEESWYEKFLMLSDFKLHKKYIKVGYYWPSSGEFGDYQPDYHKIQDDPDKLKKYKRFLKKVS